MLNLQKTAKTIGILFIIGTVSGMLSCVFSSALTTPDYLTQLTANHNQIYIGALLVLCMGISLSLMSLVMYPILRIYNETLARGMVIFRGALELLAYLGIAVNWLLLLNASKDFVSNGSPINSSYQVLGATLRNAESQIVSIWLPIVFALGALMMYYMLYKTNLIPAWLSLWGIVGALVYFGAPASVMFGANFEFFTIPLCIQEMVMAVWLIAKGFNVSSYNQLLKNKVAA
jgi:hypothetical protein